MTPKEKAQEVFNAHYMVLFDSESDKGEEILVSLLAKKCAIITITEILKSCPSTGIEFWYLVDEELEKM